MAQIPSSAKASLKNAPGSGRSYLLPLILVTSLFFLWGLANSLNGSLIKQFQIALDLNRFQAGVVDLAFYMGYFFFALPAGYFMRRYGYKKGILLGLLLYAGGAFLFYPAASVRVYGFFLFALFMIASGLAFLETAANLYVTVLGDPEKAEWRINFSQSFNGISIILGPIIGALFIFSQTEYTPEMLAALPAAEADQIRVQEALSVQGPYLFIGALVLFVAVLFALTRMPEPEVVDEVGASEKNISILSLFRHRHLRLGILAQFLNVGAQTVLWGYFVDFKLDFAREMHWALAEGYMNLINSITGTSSEALSSTQIAGFHASFALVLFMLGRFIGTSLMTRFSSSQVLTWYAVSATVLVLIGMATGGLTAVICLSLTYFCQSIMFPTIFALATKGLGAESKLASSLVIMAIVGGAFMPLIAGALFKSGPAFALIVPMVCFAYVAYYAARGYRIQA
ncbi:L-fucose:H+ symporter permease [Rhabdobacter roseus]|uniref:FHS family L-fucose permease-like MFS transporter n=1 Tax=Rhabdobacter roseus TaxID=1655419 RepID=A0A840U2C0_9BACT|nr:L-fucose:H+ symporter permease [Rhabdobacter roseus]MBB5286280.1 FHS family L-fucose permease-like MFS transporter [Rhabdobacter roseus]